MEAQGNISSEVYKRASLDTLWYFKTAFFREESILSTLREKNIEFRTMLEILKQGETKYATYLESIVKPLEKAGLLSCNSVGYCKVTDEGAEAFKRFDNDASRLDTILGGIGSLGMKALDKSYIILKSVDHLGKHEIFCFPSIPFKPSGYTDPYIEAFIEAKGSSHPFIIYITSFYHPLAFLLTAKYIIECETYCKGGYPTGKEIKEKLKRHLEEELEIYGLKPPLQIFSSSKLIKNLRNDSTLNEYYKDDRYRLTEYGEGLAKYIALHILLS